MAQIQKEALLRLVLDAEKAAKDSVELVKLLREIRDVLKEIGKLSPQAFRALSSEISKATGSTKDLIKVVESLTGLFKDGAKAAEDMADKAGGSKTKAAAGSLNDLRAELAKVRAELNNTASTIDGEANPAYTELAKKYGELDGKIKAQQAALRGSTQASKAAEGSINDLRARLNALNRELDNTAPEIDGQVNPAFERMTKEARELSDTLKKAEGASGRFQRNVGNYPQLGAQMKAVGAQFLAAFSITAVVEKAGQALASTIKVGRAFEESVSNLSAITGATGKDLAFLREEAKRLGVETGKGAAAVAESFKLIASAKPELLSNKEALVQVTEAAITLSKAAGLEVPEAANALTTVLNQMKLPASEAARVVDLLAAGAKLGAVEIPELTDAFKKFGPVAQSAGVSTAEAVAAIETLGESKFEAEIAGNALKNIFVKLQKDGLGKAKDGTLDLGLALEQLAPNLKDVKFLAEEFGLENVAAAQALISSRERFTDLTTALAAESGVAAEQARINNDNLNGDLKKLEATIEGIQLTFYEEFSSGARDATQAFTGFLAYISEGLKSGLPALTAPFKELYETTKEVFTEVGKLFESAGIKLNVFEVLLKGAAQTIGFFIKPIVEMGRKVALAVSVLVKVKEAVADFIEETPFLKAAFETVGNAVEAIVNFVKEAINSVKSFADTVATFSGIKLISSIFGTSDEELNNLEKLKAVFGDVGNALEQLRKKYNATAAELDNFKKSFDKSLLAGKTFTEQVKIVNDEFIKSITASREEQAKFDQEQAEKDLENAKQMKEAAAERGRVRKEQEAQAEQALQRLRDMVKREQDVLRERTEAGLEELRAARKRELEEDKAFARLKAEEQKVLLDAIDRDIDAKLEQLRAKRAEDAKKDLEQLVAETLDYIKAGKEAALALQEQLNLEATKALDAQEAAELALVEGSTRASLELRQSIQEEYALKRQELAAANARAALAAEQEAAEQALMVADLTAEQRIALEQELFDRTAALYNMDAEALRAAEERKQADIAKTVELKKQAVEGFADALTAIGNLQAQDADMEIERIRYNAAVEQEAKDLAAAQEIERIKMMEAVTAAQQAAQDKAVQQVMDRREKERKAEQEALDKALKQDEARKERALAFNRRVAAAQALIDQVSIVTNSIKAITEGAKVPFPGNLVAIASIIAAVAAGIAQIRTLTAPARFEDGGEVGLRGGLAQGPSHAEGGIPGRVSSTKQPIEFEGGEFIVRKASVNAKTLPLLEKINREGAYVPRVPRGYPAGYFAGGGAVPSGGSQGQGGAVSTADVQDAVKQGMQSMPPVRAYVVLSDLQGAETELDRKKRKASFG